MKRIAVVAVMLAMGLGFVACGGSGGGNDPNADAALLSSYTDFGTILSSTAFDACFNGAQTTCDCPGGGTAVFNEAARTITLQQCKSLAGKTYSGVFTISADMTSMSATMTAFGDCSSGSATDVPIGSQSSCSGEITATCAGATASCPIETDPNDASNCTLVCP